MTARDVATERVAEPALVVTGTSRELRRSLGVIAWAVLEDVVLDAVVDPAGRLVASTNVRRVAGHVGMSKDTAAAALTRLARRGLVERQPADRTGRGLFGRSVYVLHLDTADGISHLDGRLTPCRPEPGSAGAEDVVAVEPASERPQPRPDRRRTRRTAGHDQVSLFDTHHEPNR